MHNRVCASGAPMMALRSSLFKSGKLANCSLVLFVALLLKLFRFQQLPFDHVVDIHQLILVRQLAFKKVIALLNDLLEQRLFFFLHAAAARIRDRS